MAIAPGTRLGVYDVVAEIGAGGMGVVCRARDTTLDLDVALKVLPEAFTSDPDRLARFEREARLLASLNHPNIAAIHGIEESDGVRALVLELVEGPTLADLIGQGPMSSDAALPIATQIAEALGAAHEQGVVHRDLKPANIKVKPDGTVKVLDFGLAKAVQPDASDAGVSDSPTISLTAAATQTGMVIGTAAYMSPEQANGETADRRADIWSFGVVLFEMLTGRAVFEGRTVPLVLSAVLQVEPAWDRLPPSLPQPLVRLLRRCLEKDPRRRLRDIGEASIHLEEAAAAPVETVAASHSGDWERAIFFGRQRVGRLPYRGDLAQTSLRPGRTVVHHPQRRRRDSRGKLGPGRPDRLWRRARAVSRVVGRGRAGPAHDTGPVAERSRAWLADMAARRHPCRVRHHEQRDPGSGACRRGAGHADRDPSRDRWHRATLRVDGASGLCRRRLGTRGAVRPRAARHNRQAGATRRRRDGQEQWRGQLHTV